MLAISLLYMACITLRLFPLWLLSREYDEWCWILLKAFSACIEMIMIFLFFGHVIFIFQFANGVCYVTLSNLQIVDHPCLPEINSIWSWCVIFLMCCWIQLARILLRIFVSIFIQDWRREWLPTSVFLPGEFHGQRSLVGFSPRGCKESDMTEWLSFTFISCLKRGKIYFHLGLTNTVKNHFPRIYKVTGKFFKML